MSDKISPTDIQSPDQSAATATITFRSVGPDDAELLLALYASTRAEEMAMVPWTSEQQQAFISMQFAARQAEYQQKYPTATHQIILAGDRPVGHLQVARLEGEIRIIDITVTPLERNCGIGTSSLRQLLREAVPTDKAVRIYVENHNPSRRLFERLGFKPVAEHGIHLLLEWSPTASRGTQFDEESA